MSPGLLRVVIFVAALLSCSVAATAQSFPGPEDDLYRAETIVTGTGEAERARGFLIGAEDVLIKLTGRADLAVSQPAMAVIALAPDLVAEHSYEDRMKDIPIHDEQGTRDRPHYLRMRFDAEKFDRALAEQRLAKWEGKRPIVAVWLGISEPRSSYILSRDGGDGYGQREVLKDASKKRGIAIILPEAGQRAVSYSDILEAEQSALLKASIPLGADAVLYGTLDFDGNAYWNCQWAVAGEGIYTSWKMHGVTFDAALKGAIERVAAAHAGRILGDKGEGK